MAMSTDYTLSSVLGLSERARSLVHFLRKRSVKRSVQIFTRDPVFPTWSTEALFVSPGSMKKARSTQVVSRNSAGDEKPRRSSKLLLPMILITSASNIGRCRDSTMGHHGTTGFGPETCEVGESVP